MAWTKYDANGVPLKLSVNADTTTPCAMVFKNANQVINTTTAALTWEVEDLDTDNIFDPGANTRLTCRTPGRYLVWFNPSHDAAGGHDTVALRKNGTTYVVAPDAYASTYRPGVIAQAFVDLAVGDYIEAVMKTAGATTVFYQDVRGLASKATAFGMARLGPSLVVSTAGSGANFVTSLPSSPGDGKEVIYEADGTNSAYWHLKFKASSGKWVKVGGPPLYSRIDTSENTTSGSYTDLTTVGPSITVALAGNYRVGFGGVLASGGAGYGVYIAPKFGSAAVSSADEALHSTGYHVALMRSIPSQALAASDLVKLQYKTGTGTASFYSRWLELDPIFVS